MEECDIIMLMETWIDEKEWECIRGLLPRGYVWEVQYAGRKSRKGRAMGRMVLEVKEGIKREKKGWEGVLVTRVLLGAEWWKVMGIYVNENLEAKLEVLREWIEEKEEGIREC